ncbi:MAG: hypothetical protein JNN08_10100 [Bryobacterales bacterium]|nr:hypothetical protein [Bryobacterales bacterium]
MKPAPLFNIVSVILPVAGAIYAWTVYSKSSADTVGGAIGILLGAYIVFAIACLAGEASAIVALARAERPGWLSVAGAILNLSAVVPPLYFFMTKK